MISWSVDKMLKHWINTFSAFGGKAAKKKFLPGIKTYVSKQQPILSSSEVSVIWPPTRIVMTSLDN